jgi:inhibitor of KinA sporulation pathway (predicted exonuclease)
MSATLDVWKQLRLEQLSCHLLTVNHTENLANLFAQLQNQNLAISVEWIGEEPFVLCSWGIYDLNQFRTDCTRHRLTMPLSFEKHVNLKKEFARLKGVKVCGMERALAHSGLMLEGTHHRGIDDTRNIARLAQIILPVLESEALSIP